MDDVKARFGATLRSLRNRQQLTQEQLAERSGLSYKFIGEVERGAGNPTLETIAQLAEALGVTMGDLVGGSERTLPPSGEYRMSRRQLQMVREAYSSLGALVQDIPSPPYKIRRRRKKN